MSDRANAKRRRGLGRGLDALLGSTTDPDPTTSGGSNGSTGPGGSSGSSTG